MDKEDITTELKEFEKVLKEYEEELKEIDDKILQLEEKKKLQEKANEDNILIDREKVDIDKIMKLGAEITSLKEYRSIYIKAMDKKINEKAISTIREYNEKVRKHISNISNSYRGKLEELEKGYIEKKEALELEAREKEAEEKKRAVYPRKKAIKYLTEEQEKEARLLKMGY